MYGKKGRDTKSIDRTDSLFDFEFFQQLSQEDSVKSLIFGVNQFILLLNTNLHTGI
jgi:hypothetical protein